ncbi:MAG TPA: hypothetical protein VF221_17700 [Chloroflexota bacterium]
MPIDKHGSVRCSEVSLVGNSASSVLNLPEDWRLVRGAAKMVERVGELETWGELGALCRMEPVAGQARHYLIAEGQGGSGRGTSAG